MSSKSQTFSFSGKITPIEDILLTNCKAFVGLIGDDSAFSRKNALSDQIWRDVEKLVDGGDMDLLNVYSISFHKGNDTLHIDPSRTIPDPQMAGFCLELINILNKRNKPGLNRGG